MQEWVMAFVVSIIGGGLCNYYMGDEHSRIRTYVEKLKNKRRQKSYDKWIMSIINNRFLPVEFGLTISFIFFCCACFLFIGTVLQAIDLYIHNDGTNAWVTRSFLAIAFLVWFFFSGKSFFNEFILDVQRKMFNLSFSALSDVANTEELREFWMLFVHVKVNNVESLDDFSRCYTRLCSKYGLEKLQPFWDAQTRDEFHDAVTESEPSLENEPS